MFDFIRNHQLSVMHFLCAISTMMALLLFITKFLPKRRKYILIGMEVIATLLLAFDRCAYLYSGNTEAIGYVMVRLSNFMVFFLTSGVVFCFNLYLADLIGTCAHTEETSRRLKFTAVTSTVGMLLAVVNIFTGLYYTFDAENHYHRGTGFLIAYIIPVVCPLIQFTVIHKYRKTFSRFIYTALILYIFVPIVVGIIQIFTYGLSIVNMAMVLVSVSLYIFTYLDINDEVQRMHNLEMEALKEEHKNMKHLFSQTATAFVSALEMRNELLKGLSQRTADLAFKIAQSCGKNEDECYQAYYVGMLHNAGIESLPESLIGKMQDFTADEERQLQALPALSADILTHITAFPYLSQNVRHINERYDGKGVPEGLKGDAIPETARIVAVAKEYVSMTSQGKVRKTLPKALVREEFVKEAGLRFDPAFANAMVHLIDAEISEQAGTALSPLPETLTCSQYRSAETPGILIQKQYTEISFCCTATAKEGEFSAPALILFDSFDKRVHKSQTAIDAYHYIEYGEIWFDGHVISTSARNMEVHVEKKEPHDAQTALYKIRAVRFEDHLLIKTETAFSTAEVIVALSDASKAAYIAITGEHCALSELQMHVTQASADESTIPRIAEPVSYIDHFASDVPNVQINSLRSSYSEGVLLKKQTKLYFHTMSLPEANLVWHCPYIVLYYADDGKVGGRSYREYACIKLNGEDDGSNAFAENTFRMKRLTAFESWNKWKEANKAGYECKVDFAKNGNKITLSTENLGIAIENQTTVFESKGAVYAALTGDQCAITDIRVL